MIRLFGIYMLLGGAILSSCLNEKIVEDNRDEVQVGDGLPWFSIELEDGTLINRDSLKGRVSLILFFNTACGDCRNELPIVQHLYESYGGDICFVCISREQTETSVREYWDQQALTLPFSAQPDRSIYNLFATNAIPRIYIADSLCVVRASFTDNPLATKEDLLVALKQAGGLLFH